MKTSVSNSLSTVSLYPIHHLILPSMPLVFIPSNTLLLNSFRSTSFSSPSLSLSFLLFFRAFIDFLIPFLRVSLLFLLVFHSVTICGVLFVRYQGLSLVSFQVQFFEEVLDSLIVHFKLTQSFLIIFDSDLFTTQEFPEIECYPSY